MIGRKTKFNQPKSITRTPPIKQNSQSLTTLENDVLPNYSIDDGKVRIAIIATGSWGDNINSTLMLKPLRKKFPESIIDIYSSNLYASAFHNNPYINRLIRFKVIHKQEALHLVHTIPPLIKNSGYNYIFNPHPMINAGKWSSNLHPEFGDNLIYAWVRALEQANISYDLPLETILKLSNDEIIRVDKFCSSVFEFAGRTKNLIENGPESNQTFVKHDLMFKIMDMFCGYGQIVFASMKTNSNNFNILKRKHPKLFYYVGQLSIRECAELYNRSNRFISLSSGLTNACNTNWCKKDVEWIEIINSMVVASAPIRSDNKSFWLEDNHEKLLNFLKEKIRRG